jgi:ABC-type branched-subunit amino acid transport system substrate-binding protein
MATGTAAHDRLHRLSELQAAAPSNRAAALLGAVLFLIAAPSGAASLSPDEEAGRAIFQDGESVFGDVFSGRLGIAQQRVPGTAARCANCHGSDGRGRPEGGVRPANITWSELTKPYGHEHDNGRRHSAFDEASLKRALTQGVDPDGNPLDGVMPRVELSDRDFHALVAYLKKLEFLLDPGVSADTLRLGTLLPSAGRFGELGLAVKGMLQAYIATINKSGGIYGRRLELVAAEYTEDHAATTRELRKLIAEGDIFALLSPFVPGIEQDLERLANQAKIPVIGPLSLFSDDPRRINQYVFHLLSGVGELAEALALHVGNEPGVKANPAVLLHPDSANGSAVTGAVEDWLKSQGWTRLSRIGFRPGAFDAAAVTKKIKERKARTVFLLGPGADVRMLANEAVKFSRPPLLLLPGPLVPRTMLDMPLALEGRVLLAYPTIPADQKPGALSEYANLFRDPAIVRSHQTSQVPAYSSAVMLVEVLKRVGRDLTRQKLVSALEAMQGFEPGLVPAVSFNAKRRLGAPGGYIIALDLKNKNFSRTGDFVHLP